MDNGLAALKTQITTMFMMNNSNNKNNKNDIFMLIYTMIFMNLIEVIFKQLPSFGNFVKVMVITYWNKKKGQLPRLTASTTNADGSKKTEVIYSITLQRPFYKADSVKATNNQAGTTAAINIDKIDAVIEHLCGLSNVKNVKMGTRYSLNNVDEIELTPLLKAKVRESGDIDGEADGLIEVVIFSSILNIPEIRKWIDEIYSNYLFEKNNKLGNGIYYFNEVPVEPPFLFDANDKEQKERMYRWDNAPKNLMFQMTEFRTSKSFTNIYGNHVSEMKERLDLFVNHPEWYIERGIPHSLGILLHGVPGGGKTSTIKAIAKDTNRHIFNLSLRKYTTQQQLTNLFFNDAVGIFREGNKESFRIPLNKRGYVIEDIDCLTDVVFDREFYPRDSTTTSPATVAGDSVTLSFLLNLLDGVLETPGRILIITTNYPEKLDRALIRPGRIDVKIEFTYTDRSFILDMLNKFYSIQWSLEDIPEVLENIFTPAEVMESMCTYFKDPKKALEHMVRKHIAKQSAENKRFAGIMERSGIPFVNTDTLVRDSSSNSNSNSSSDDKDNNDNKDNNDDSYNEGPLQDNSVEPSVTLVRDKGVDTTHVKLLHFKDLPSLLPSHLPIDKLPVKMEAVIPLLDNDKHMSYESAYDMGMIGGNAVNSFEFAFDYKIDPTK